MTTAQRIQFGAADAEALVQRARELGPPITAAADRIEAEGALPPELLDELHEAGVFRMFLPASVGGLEADPITCGRVVEELARADGSVGWCAMIAWQCAMAVGFMPEAEAREVYGSPRAVAAAVARATGTATPVEGGYCIAGRWPFASGSLHATWFGGECQLLEADGATPLKDQKGDTPSRIFLVPRSEVTIHQTWDVAGLRGTGSNDFSIEGVVVPAARSMQSVGDTPHHSNPRYKNLGLDFIGHGSIMLGIGGGALDAAKAIGQARRGYGGSLMKDRAEFQYTVAQAQALIEAGRAYLYGSASDLWSHLLSGADSTPEQRARLRLAMSHAAANSVRAVDLMYESLGTSSLFHNSPLDRRFRDVHAAAAHVMIGRFTLEAAGRVALGKDAEFPFF